MTARWATRVHMMRTATVTLVVNLVALIPSVTLLEAAGISTGSGVVIGSRGDVLTNSHVVENCEKITLRLSSTNSATAVLVASDKRNDLAVIRTETPVGSVASFREAPGIRTGDTVVALGFPLSGLLATTANLSVGNVSALAGLGDDSRYVQISAPVQPGNSGGPLLDASGHLVEEGS
jgi:S1-C subfamily serine protease